jgi:Trk K+ transport system NAD-binding subunit
VAAVWRGDGASLVKVIIIGSGSRGSSLARALADNDHEVTVVEIEHARLSTLPPGPVQSGDIRTITGDGTRIAVLEDAGIDSADILFCLTGRDAVNGLITQKAKILYKTRSVVAGVKDPRMKQVLESHGIIAVDGAAAMTERLLSSMPSGRQETEPALAVPAEETGAL